MKFKRRETATTKDLLRRRRTHTNHVVFRNQSCWADGWTGYVAQIASIACGYEISPVGFTRRSRVYRRDAIRFQGFVEIERTSLIFDYY